MVPAGLILVVAIAGLAYQFRDSWLRQANEAVLSVAPAPRHTSTSVPPSQPTRTTSPTAVVPATTVAAPTPVVAPSVVGVVTIAPSLDYAQVFDVALMFDTYFSSINAMTTIAR